MELPDQFRYFVKADDDVFLDVRALYKAITNKTVPNSFIMGNTVSGAPPFRYKVL